MAPASHPVKEVSTTINNERGMIQVHTVIWIWEQSRRMTRLVAVVEGKHVFGHVLGDGLDGCYRTKAH